MVRRIALLAALLASSSCLVEEACYQGDCPAGLRCIEDRCQLECVEDEDCRTSVFDTGKRCIDNRCRFAFAERPDAPPLCLEVANPKSGIAGETRCIDDERGKVVMLFFGLLA